MVLANLGWQLPSLPTQLLRPCHCQSDTPTYYIITASALYYNKLGQIIFEAVFIWICIIPQGPPLQFDEIFPHFRSLIEIDNYLGNLI